MTDFEPTTPAVFVGVDPRGGVTHYRTMLPARALKASLFVRTTDLDKMKLVGDVDAPVAVYSMPRSEEMIREAMQLVVHPDRALIIDIDDSLRAVAEMGEHPSAKGWAELVDKHEWLLTKADLVTCATDWLAEYAQSLGARRTMVIPNALDIDRWNHKREPRHKDFTIVGWSGSLGHEEALRAHAPALEDLLRRREDIAFASVGRPLSRFFPEDIRHRFHDVGFVPIAKHPQVLTQFHINIGPTLETDFYRAKSDLRALEAMASDSYFIGGATTYGGLPAIEEVRSPEVMAHAIEWAIDHPKVNHDQRKLASQYVRSERLIQHTAPLWRQAINSVLP